MRRPNHGGNLAWAAALAGCSPSFILDFSASINPLGPPRSAIAAIQSHLADLVAYPEPNYHQLRVSLNQLHPTLTPDWILPGNGSAELLTWACRELAALEETCLLTPAFGDYQRALKAFSAKVRKYPLKDFEFILQNPGRYLISEETDGLLAIGKTSEPRAPKSRSLPFLEETSRNQRPKIQNRQGLLLNNPHNPTGQLFDRELLLPLLEQFALVVVDEAFMDFLPPDQEQSLIPVVRDYPNLVILRSLTKFYSLPGLRLGYAVAHPNRLQRWQQWRDPWSVNVLAAAAATAVVADEDFQQQTWDWLPPARSELLQGLAAFPGLHPAPSAANFLLVQSEQSSSQLQETLLKHHQIFIRDCLSFPELGDRYFRVAVRTKADNQRLLEGLEAIL